MTHQEVTLSRGEIMEQFISIEKGIDTIITYSYFGEAKKKFLYDFLGNELLSFGFKKNVLKQIVSDDAKETNKKINDLEELNRIRNLFAHASLSVKNGKDIDDPKAEVRFVDPRKPGCYIEPQKKKEEFFYLLPDIISWILKVLKENGCDIDWK